MRPGGEPERVTICEVGPRDGLQNEDVLVPASAKVRFLEMLAAAGLPMIEATSFVHPKWIPQLADAEEVYTRVRHLSGPSCRLLALVPNARGYERARAVGVDGVCLFTAASETFNRRNINASVAGSFDRFTRVVERAREEGVWMRGYVSVAFGCPYEGQIGHEEVLRVARRLHEAGCGQVVLSDTIGVATPESTIALLDFVSRELPLDRIALHMHDVQGRAIANLEAAWRFGVSTFDCATGGLGGCPYAPGAPGNLATERVLRLFRDRGVETGVDLDRVRASARFIAEVIGGAGAEITGG